MAVDHIRYDLLTQQALRGVLRRVLADVAKTSALPGDHHFFITFNTQALGVRMSSRLRAEYPEAMTIVLQHQFWDLSVSEHQFEVGLSFGGVTEHLVVPFESVTGFFDPSVQFGLQFVAEEAEAGETPATGPKPTAVPQAPVRAVETPKAGRPVRKPVAPAATEKKGKAEAPAPVVEAPPPEKPPSGGAEVVRLDRFRKK